MAIIPQTNLFTWEEIEELGDLDRLRLVIDYLPDDNLMGFLEKERRNGRDDYPVRVVWNCMLAGIVFEHKSIESLRRELKRNAQLRWMCGINIGKTPPSYVFSRFMKKLIANEEKIEEMFEMSVEELYDLLPDFLAIDGKAISSFANRENKKEKEDGRRDKDADYGRKEYRGKHEDGTVWEKIVKWFGYKIHLIVDSVYELPIAYSVTKASVPDINEAHSMVENIKDTRSFILEEAETLQSDKGYEQSYTSICGIAITMLCIIVREMFTVTVCQWKRARDGVWRF